MTLLSEQDYQQVLSALQKIYASSHLQKFSAHMLKAVQTVIAAEVAGYCSIDFVQDQLLGGSPLPQLSHTCVKEVVDQHLHEHPLTTHYLRTRDAGAYKLSDFVSERQLHQIEGIYQNFLRPMNMEDQFAITLPHGNSLQVDAVALFRSDRSFTERDRALLNLLQPHLVQALQTAHLFSRVQQENQQLRCSFHAAGGVLISREGRIQFMARKVEQWLRQYFPVKQLSQSLPEQLQRWVKYQQTLFTQSGSIGNPRLPLKVEQEGRQLIARFVSDPTQDQDLLLFEEQQRPNLSAASFELLGLSKREAEVLYWVAQGKENAEIAELLHVGATTVRKHLEHIYQKLEVKTRASAVVEALRRLGMLN